MAYCIVCKTDKITQEDLDNCEKEGLSGIYCEACLKALLDVTDRKLKK